VVHGSYQERFSGVRDVLSSTVDSGLDVGAAIAVYIDGEPAVDIWGGHTDLARTRPWHEDSITIVWSVAKTMTTMCALVLADRGELDFDAPVARYWPEFAEAGKGAVTVGQVLSHSAGLPDWDEPLTVDDLFDWSKATAPLARQAPRWEPGTASGYHALTQGYLIGEVVRRVYGRSIGAYFAEEIAGPLRADFRFTLPADQHHRLSRIIEHTEPRDAATAGHTPPLRTLFAPRESWTPAWLAAEIPAVAGYGNARSVAAIQSVLACGGMARGVRLMSEETARSTLREWTNGRDLILGAPMRFGAGFALNSPDIALLPNPNTVWWDGWGGSLVVVDFDARMAIAYVVNHMRSREYVIGDKRGMEVLRAVYSALGHRT